MLQMGLPVESPEKSRCVSVLKNTLHPNMQSLNSSSINDASYQKKKKREREREEEGKLQVLNLAHTKEKLQREA